jgi:hypothetical protein
MHHKKSSSATTENGTVSRMAKRRSIKNVIASQRTEHRHSMPRHNQLILKHNTCSVYRTVFHFP